MSNPLPLPRMCLRVGGVGNRMFGEQRGVREDSAKIEPLLRSACSQVFAQLEQILDFVLADDHTAQPLKWPARPNLWNRSMCRLLGKSDRWGLDALRARGHVTVFSTETPWVRVFTGGADGADQLIEAVARDRATSTSGNVSPTHYTIERIHIGDPATELAGELAVGTLPDKYSVPGPAPHDRKDKQRESETARQRAFGFRAQSEALRHHSDLLVAIWDHDTEAKPGGTWETVQRALADQIPVIAILIRGEDRCEIRILEKEQDLQTPLTDEKSWQQQLSQIVSAMLRFPDRHRIGNPDQSGYHPRAAFLKLCSGEQPEQIWTGRIWKSFQTFSIWLDLRHQRHAAAHAGDATAPPEPGKIREARNEAFKRFCDVFICFTKKSEAATKIPEKNGEYLTEYEPIRKLASSNGFSGVFGDAHRGGIVASYVMAAFAVLLAVLGSVIHSLHGPNWMLVLLAAVELMTIVMMIAISDCSETEDWNTTWAESRVLAEALRFMKYLGPLGVHTRLPKLPYYLRGDSATPAPEAMWSVWYFRALIRTAPLRLKPAAKSPVEGAKVLEELIQGQLDYHQNNARRNQTLHHSIESTSFKLFLAVLGCVTLHLLDVVFGWHKMAVPGLVICVCGPTFIAALHGLASQLELIRLRQRSSSVSRLLAERLKTVKSLETRPGDPASAEAAWGLAAESLETTSLLIDETAGWSMLYTNTGIHPG